MADSPRTRAASNDDTPAKPTVRDAVAEAHEEVAPDVPEFPVERLIAESAAFVGQPTWIVAGALSTIRKKTLTVAEVQAAVKAFLATELPPSEVS